jgi:hypothetical protein
MAFGPNSFNPRVRRAYAHTMLNKAMETGSIEDLHAAKAAVNNTHGEKSNRSGFKGALLNAALADTATKTIVSIAQDVLTNGDVGPRLNVLTDTYMVGVRRNTDDFSIVNRSGAYLGRTEVRRHEDDGLNVFTPLTVTEHDGDRRPYIIPTIYSTGEVDVITIRHLPEDRRNNLARMVGRLSNAH